MPRTLTLRRIRVWGALALLMALVLPSLTFARGRPVVRPEPPAYHPDVRLDRTQPTAPGLDRPPLTLEELKQRLNREPTQDEIDDMRRRAKRQKDLDEKAQKQAAEQRKKQQEE